MVSIYLPPSLENELLESKDHILVALYLAQRCLYVYKMERERGKEGSVSQGEISKGFLYMERWK